MFIRCSIAFILSFFFLPINILASEDEEPVDILFADSLFYEHDFIGAYYAYQDYLDFLENHDSNSNSDALYQAGRCAMHIGAYDAALNSFSMADLIGQSIDGQLPTSLILSEIMKVRLQLAGGSILYMTPEDIALYKEQYKSLGDTDPTIELFITVNDLLYEAEVARINGDKSAIFNTFKKFREVIDEEHAEGIGEGDLCLMKLDCIKVAYYCGQNRTALNLIGDLIDELISNDLVQSDIFTSALFYRTMIYYNAGISEEEITRYYIWNIQENIEKSFYRLTHELRRELWSRYHHSLANIIPMQAQKKPDIGNDAYDAVLLVKGLQLHWSISIENVARTSDDKELMDIIRQMKAIEEEAINVKSLYFSSQLTTRKNALERKLMSHMHIEDFPLVSTSDDVRSNIGDEDVAIEFVRYDMGNSILKDHKYQYLALILKPDTKNVDVVSLPSEEEMSQYIEYPERTAEIWKLLADYIGDAKRIYFSPDGMLTILPLESFITGRQVYRLTSTRELCQMPTSPGSNKRILLVGGLDFDAFTSNTKADAVEPALVQGDLQLNLHTSGELREAVGILDYLPGSLTEVKTINDILKDNAKVVHDVTTLVGADCDENTFKTTTAQNHYDVIHIATHGFNVPVKGGYGDVMDLGVQYNPLVVTDNAEALLYSGLFLSGANAFLGSESLTKGQNNNVLTAFETSCMNFSGCELLALSACETAKGEASSEGVFGLQRGFKLAGVHSVLMSLWKVDDKATCKLMTEFYSNWIGKNMTKRDALEEAKSAIRETKGWEDPIYWAAFILLDGLN